MEVTFRPLVDDDLPLLHGWLNEPGVVRWWEGDDVSWEAVVREYGSANQEPTEHWLAHVEGAAVGWLQCYAWASYPEEAAPYWAVGIEPSAAGIDYLVGDPARRGRGLGAAMIRSFVRDVVFARHPEWTQVATAPHVDNVASWGALERAGFRFVGEIEDRTGPGRVMAVERGGQAAASGVRVGG